MSWCCLRRTGGSTQCEDKLEEFEAHEDKDTGFAEAGGNRATERPMPTRDDEDWRRTISNGRRQAMAATAADEGRLY